MNLLLPLRWLKSPRPKKTPPTGPRIFGIGLSRTGTSSLHEALGLLGFRSGHYLPDDGIMAYLQGRAPFHMKQWLDYEAVSDTPVCSLVPELDAACPGARFILTTRPLESWLASCRRHWSRQEVFQTLHNPPPKTGIRSQWRFLCRQRVYGRQDFDETAFAAVFAAHHEAVMRHFSGRPQDLLVLDLSQPLKWEPLCAFLNLDIPQVAFPWSNRYVYAAKHAGARRLRHGVDRAWPAGNLQHVVVPWGPGAQEGRVLEAEQTDALLRCNEFEIPESSLALKDLAHTIDPSRPAAEVWTELQGQGLLVEESNWLPPPSSETVAALCHAAIPTSGRGLAALTVARELAHDATTQGIPATITLANLDRNADAEALRLAAASENANLRWTGAAEVDAFLRLLEKEGFPRPVTNFLFTGDDAPFRCGAVRNCLLAAHAGKTFLFQDDDVHGPLTDIRRSEEPRLLVGEPPGRVFRIFPDMAGAEAAGLNCPDTVWERHRSFLGRLVGDLRVANGGLEVDLGPVDDGLLGLVRRPDARVRATFLGFRGDAGTAEGSLRWDKPASIANPWLSDPDIYAATRHSRAWVMGSAQHSLNQQGFHFISVALDARALLPPFLPQGRGSDLLFVRCLCRAEPTALCAHLPWTVRHHPVHPRPPFLPVDHPDAIFPWITSFMLLQDVTRESRAPGPLALARLAIDIASLDADGLRDWMTTQLRSRTARWLEQLETLRRETQPCPQAAADLECLMRRCENFYIHAPRLGPADHGHSEGTATFQRLLKHWAEAMALWPDLWQALLHHPEWSDVLAPPASKSRTVL
jgi:hypothetical protein